MRAPSIRNMPCFSRRIHWEQKSGPKYAEKYGSPDVWVGSVDLLRVRKALHPCMCEGCGLHIPAGSLHASGSTRRNGDDHYCLNCIDFVNDPPAPVVRTLDNAPSADEISGERYLKAGVKYLRSGGTHAGIRQV